MIEAMERIRPSTFCAPATIYRFLIKEDLSKYDFSYIEHACLAGEPLNPEVFHQIERLTGMRIYEGFGQSESSVLLANYPWVEIKPGSMGKPAPGYDIALLDENGVQCEDGMVGSICIRVDKGHPTGLFRDYWKDATKRRPAKRGAAACIIPATPHGATATATIGSSAETTTLSSAPATA